MIYVAKGPERPEMVVLTHRDIHEIMVYYLELEPEDVDAFWEVAIRETTPPSLEDEARWHANFERAFRNVSG